MRSLKNEVRVPRTMSTQHPDNANVPEWASHGVIDGDAEIFEAFFAYSTLGCQEVMWDSEGKDADTRVVRKLLERHREYFSKHVIGEDVFLTYRVPNPKIEAVEKKVFVETLQNIPVACDVASSFYHREVAPIFEVILPFTTDAKELLMLHEYYKKAIVEDEDVFLCDGLKAKDLLGTFKPRRISVIPLVEDYESILSVNSIVRPYVEAVKPKHLRVFIARSDPALNYGLPCAVLLSKIALSKLKKLESETSAAIHPIIGVGSKPFRGHLSPENAEAFLQEYMGLTTVTIQSAARYDYSPESVKAFIERMNSALPNSQPTPIEKEEEQTLIQVLQKCRKQYERTIEGLAPLINSVASYVPQRRARKLHIGLFGYSRNVAGISLPRAIPFAAALYTIGLPPEFIGWKALNDLNESEWSSLTKHYVKLAHDLNTVAGYVSWENLNILMENRGEIAKKANMNEDALRYALTMILSDLQTVEEKLNVKLGPRSLTQRKHENFTNNFLIAYIEGAHEEARKALIEAAILRKCLG